MAALRLPVLQSELERPTNRSQCRGGQRPCPWVSCRYHLLLDVAESGRLMFARPLSTNRSGHYVEPDSEAVLATIASMQETCALDVADQHEDVGISSSAIGELLDVQHDAIDDIVQGLRDQLEPEDFEHPDDPYLRWAVMSPEAQRRRLRKDKP